MSSTNTTPPRLLMSSPLAGASLARSLQQIPPPLRQPRAPIATPCWKPGTLAPPLLPASLRRWLASIRSRSPAVRFVKNRPSQLHKRSFGTSACGYYDRRRDREEAAQLLSPAGTRMRSPEQEEVPATSLQMQATPRISGCSKDAYGHNDHGPTSDGSGTADEDGDGRDARI